MAECVDPIPLENLDFCPTIEVAAGVSETGVYGAAVSDFETIVAPPNIADGTDLDSIGTIATAHTFKEGRGFHKIYINPDTGLIESTHAGEKGNLSIGNSLTGALPGTGPKVVGYVRKYKNMPMIFIVKEKDGAVRQLGSALSPAYMSEITATSGQKAGDPKTTTIKITDTLAYMAPHYAATIEEFPVPAP
ncbi:hypothetical protein [Aequorivita echinoideorum]|uniref:Microcystin-dependent protein n=1 Tax=Aequorivita echinoideorum TaxID=1549647 RepID=A0ABS5S5E5_9FLAO|nr:hypothetical protein [Aequorivita echinoideorum]MBT0607634.1 hypothetical protein [Aequorivita echinoideorum]